MAGNKYPVAMRQVQGGLSIRGSGGGGKDGGGSIRSPYEQPDDLHSTAYAVILDLISNGEIEGPVHAAAPLRDIYLDGTPIENADGSLNFGDVQVEIRHGTQDQTYIPGIPASASTTQVNVQIKESQPWSQLLTNEDLSAVRVTLRWPALMRVIESGENMGDRVGTTVAYAIDLAIGSGGFTNVITTEVSGKGSGYERTHRIELPETDQGWTVRVRRLTQDSTSGSLSDDMYAVSYAEVIDGKFRYPMSALVGIKIDASQFTAIPTRAYHMRGRKIRVPSNYNPETRSYIGVWDGTFKVAHSNNPAWVFYDMCVSGLYGLGDRITAQDIDRYALYQIGAYCDQMVDDGQGGQEPRFVCNAYIQGQADALRVLNDLTSTFRGMCYWADSQVYTVADMPADPVYTYSNANVIDGRFEYSGADLSTRKTVALVSWNDPSDFSRAKVEVVNDPDGIRRYGIRKVEIPAFGCTSRGQAQRIGLYSLYTSRMETDGVTFAVGLDGVIPQPGSLVNVADRNRAGRRIGGRLQAATDTVLVLDLGIEISIGDKITVNLPDGTTQTRTVSGVGGTTWDRGAFWDNGQVWDGAAIEGLFWDSQERWDEAQTWDGQYSSVVRVSQAFDVAPTREAVWGIESDDLVMQTIRVMSVRDIGDLKYQIEGVRHHPGKFDAIDNGARLDPLPISVIPPRAQAAPTNVAISASTSFHQGTTRTSAEITWDPAPNATHYDVQWRRDASEWVQVPRTAGLLVDIPDIYAGEYIARVRAVNALEVPSLWAYSDPTALSGIIGAPPTVTSLTAFGEVMAIKLSWGYPAGPSIVDKIEIRASLTNDFGDSSLITTLAYPTTTYTMFGLAYSAKFWFWVRLIDKNGTPGDWYPSELGAGVVGEPNKNPADLISYLEGQIAKSHLAQELATQINTDHDAIVEVSEDLEDLDDALKASYQVKTQVRTDDKVVVTGFAVGASIDPNGTTRSEFLIRADTIGFLNTIDGSIHAPFIFDTLNDTAFLAAAFIEDATITTAKIAAAAITEAKIKDAAITNAKIKDGEITDAKIEDATITGAKIKDAEITSAKIGDAEVGTLKIDGQAVSTTIVSNSGFSFSLNVDSDVVMQIMTRNRNPANAPESLTVSVGSTGGGGFSVGATTITGVEQVFGSPYVVRGVAVGGGSVGAGSCTVSISESGSGWTGDRLIALTILRR